MGVNIAEPLADALARAYQVMSANNPSRQVRARRPKGPEFALTGIFIGIVVGWAVGLGIEILIKPNMIFMVGTGLAGLGLGAGFEAIRFLWRTRRSVTGKRTEY